MKKKKKNLKIKLLEGLNNYMKNSFNSKYESLLENFKSIRTVRREFYPKNFKLSEEFVKAFKNEYKRLVGEGHHPRKALARINKALLFHSQ
jgi:hypothetical protein